MAKQCGPHRGFTRSDDKVGENHKLLNFKCRISSIRGFHVYLTELASSQFGCHIDTSNVLKDKYHNRGHLDICHKEYLGGEVWLAKFSSIDEMEIID